MKLENSSFKVADEKNVAFGWRAEHIHYYPVDRLMVGLGVLAAFDGRLPHLFLCLSEPYRSRSKTIGKKGQADRGDVKRTAFGKVHA